MNRHIVIDNTENFVDKTVLSTPRPRASSTVERKEILRKIDRKYGIPPADTSSIYEENQSDSSLGIIYDIEQKEDLINSKDSIGDASIHLQRQRELAQGALQRSKFGLPSRFLIASNTPCSATKGPYNDNSTVNESDLLRSRENELRSSIASGTFIPADVSTPKNSNTIANTEQSNRTLASLIDEASKKIRNSDVNLRDLCTELSRLSMGTQLGVSNIDSGIFTPAELMQEKLLTDELHWREKHDIPTKLQSSSNMSNFNNYNDQGEKYSMGDFFKQRSENMVPNFFRESPPKSDPIPLVDITNSTLEESKREQSSVMSATQIYKVLSEYGTQDAQQILSCLINKNSQQKVQRKSNESFTSEKDVDEYILANKGNKSNINLEPNNYGQPSDFNYHKQLSLSRSSTISPTISPNEDRTGNSKYNKFCHNLEVQSSSKISPASVTNVQTEKSPTLLKSSSNAESKRSKSPLYPNSNGKNVDRRYLDVNCGNYLYQPNSLANSPTENKENVSDGDRSLTSVRSGSSLDTLPEGKFPIKSNRLELIWGCLKPGRTATQEFQIKNQLNQRIRMQASVTGSNFRIVKDSFEPEMLTVISFVLRPLETKCFSIMFCPSSLGAAYERINFHPILGREVQQSKRQVLTLFGYGGHVNCNLSNITKDSSGKLWLSLGKIEYQLCVEQKFVIKNSGSLFAFACMDVIAKGPFTFSDLKVEPKEFIIKPQEEVSVTVRYYPSKEDLKHLKKTDIVEVGHIKIITGSEVTRGRLRRLYGKLKQKDTPVDPLIEKLSKPFPGEKMPSDLRSFRESVGATRDLLLQLLFREITVTIEQDLEKTLVNPIDMNESSTYHTLYQYDESVTRFGDTTALIRDNPSLFNIEPTNIILTLPMKREDTILLYSKNPQEMTFEIKTEPDYLFNVYPTDGVIRPYETIVLKLVCRQQSPMIDNFGRVLVYVENEVMEVIVKTIFIKSS